MEESGEQQEVPFDKLSSDERKFILEKTLNEIYTRLDNARRLGVNISAEGKTSSPFRAEDEVAENDFKLIAEYTKAIALAAKERAFVPKEKDGVRFHEFKKNNVTIRIPVEGNTESMRYVGGDVDISTVDGQNRTVDVKWRHVEDASFFDATIEFPTEDEYEGLTYKASDIMNPMNNEEYIVISSSIHNAYGEVFDMKGVDFLAKPNASPNSEQAP